MATGIHGVRVKCQGKFSGSGEFTLALYSDPFTADPFTGHHSMGWAAELKLEFDDQGERTRLRRKGSFGPLYIQKPFYPEGNLCHLYLLHPPGGVAGGDTLAFHANVKSGAQVLITNPAATKFLRSDSKLAQQQQFIKVADCASAEWLPQETIVFNDAHAQNKTVVQLDGNAAFVGCEVVSLGRPASQEKFVSGTYESLLRLERYCATTDRYRVVFLDHQRYSGASTELDQSWGLAGKPVFGMMVATPVDEDILGSFQRLQAKMTGPEEPVYSTLIGNVLVMRCVGESTSTVLDQLRARWSLLRPTMLQRAPHIPDIWRT